MLILLLPRGSAEVAAVLLWTAVTLARGERGIARWFPRLPLFGSLIAAITILIRWYALESLHWYPRQMLASVVACLAMGQASAIALEWISRPVDETAFQRLLGIDTRGAVIAMCEGAAAAFLLGIPLGIATILTAYVLIRVVAWFTAMRCGGIRGLDPDALRVLFETTSLAVLAGVITGR